MGIMIIFITHSLSLAVMEPKYAKINNRDYLLKKPHNKFKFECQKCGECCQSKILLSTYDIIRLCHALRMKTPEFHKKFTRFIVSKKTKIPVCVLNTAPVCKFLKKNEGCQVYDHRPYMCRAYPIGDLGKHYFIEDSYCPGCKKGKKQSIEEWIESSDVRSYKMFDDLWQEFLFNVKMYAKDMPQTKTFQFSFVKMLYDFDNKKVDELLKTTKLKADNPTDKFVALLGLAEKLIIKK